MGYYSTLEGAHTFKTWCRSDSDIRKIFDQTFAGHPELREIKDMGYDLVLREEDGVYFLDIDADEYTRKHWYENELANLIQKLVEPGARTYLIFAGEDSEIWAYAITSERLVDIEVCYHVNGQPLEDWMNEAA